MTIMKARPVAIVLVLLLAGGSVWYWRTHATSAATAPGGAPAGGMLAMSVDVATVQAVSWDDDLSLVGTLYANESVTLSPEVAGRISAIHFKDGQAVRKGQTLFTLDAQTQQADVKQAQANEALARANAARTADLFERKFVSQSALDQANATHKVQQAALTQAQSRLGKMQLVSPFDGTAGIRHVSVGEYVKDGTQLVNIEDDSTLKVDFRLPERALARMGQAVGQEIELGVDAHPGEHYRATVVAVDPAVDEKDRSVLVRARLDNHSHALRPGMFSRVRIIFAQRQGVLVVPEEAIVPDGKGSAVFVVNGEGAQAKVQRVNVTTGVRKQAQVEISSGLNEGQQVVVAGQMKLRDGMPVRLPQADAAAAPAAAPAATPAGASSAPAKP